MVGDTRWRSESSTDGQRRAIYGMLKNSGLYEPRVENMKDTIPHTEYDRQRGSKTWDWINGLSKGEASDIITYLEENE